MPQLSNDHRLRRRRPGAASTAEQQRLDILFLSALSAAIGTSFYLKPDSRFMEYVWKAAEGVSSTLEKTLWFVAVYLVLITILVATLKIKDDK
jgi:preprotein translocase subunit SecG